MYKLAQLEDKRTTLENVAWYMCIGNCVGRQNWNGKISIPQIKW